MNEPEAVEKHCVTKFKDFEHWMESFIYPREKEFYKYMPNTTEPSTKKEKKRPREEASSEDEDEEEIKPKKHKSHNIQKCSIPYCRNAAVEQDHKCNQCHFRDSKRCTNKIAPGYQKYCASHKGGRQQSKEDE